MTVPGARAGARKTLRPMVFLGVLLAVLTAGPGIVTAAPASDIPQRLSELSTEQQSWRDADDVIWCSAHPQFTGCAETGAALGYRYPADDTPFVVRVSGEGGAR
ncbi:hypothetical protein [Nocardia brasiliensis]|uniref:hypothetical protein n=1 Tax=Nocardia brasiliensis TaxID=37326 RepID=UPI0024569D8C|nr:hypothetical protein [Nocardia brasiliensis]